MYNQRYQHQYQKPDVSAQSLPLTHGTSTEMPKKQPVSLYAPMTSRTVQTHLPMETARHAAQICSSLFSTYALLQTIFKQGCPVAILDIIAVLYP